MARIGADLIIGNIVIGYLGHELRSFIPPKVDYILGIYASVIRVFMKETLSWLARHNNPV